MHNTQTPMHKQHGVTCADTGFVVLYHKTYLCRHSEHGPGCRVTCKSEAPHLLMGKEPFQL